MPIVSVADFPSDEASGTADGEAMPPFGPGGIYHEKQVGALCAVHCVNNLLQGPHFDAGQLAEVGHQLDAEERRLLGGAALDQGGNVRADGFFNVQVIRAALQVRGFEMERLSGENAKAAAAEPAKQQGFVFNKKEHWFALRRIGQEWFDLNSCLRTPRHFTDRELASTVNEALSEGYTVFTVAGNYPSCELEQNSKKLLEAVQGCGHFRQTHTLFAGQGHSLRESGPSNSTTSSTPVDPELLAAAEADPELAAAIAASLSCSPPAETAPAEPTKRPLAAVDDKEEMRRKRLARFGAAG